MPDAYALLPNGQKLDESELTVGQNTVERPRNITADPTDALGLGKVINTAPAGTEYAPVVREAQMGTSATGVNQPTGGSGLLGWLSGIYSKLAGTLTVGGTVIANAGTNMSTAALALETGNLATVVTNTGKIPAQGAALKASSLPVTLATDQPSVPTNAQIGAPLLPTGAANLTISTDGAYTFASLVHHVVVQNNTATAAGVAFDAAATAGSYQVPANSERAFDLACTVLHLFSAAASAVNGTATANIVVMGAV